MVDRAVRGHERDYHPVTLYGVSPWLARAIGRFSFRPTSYSALEALSETLTLAELSDETIQVFHVVDDALGFIGAAVSSEGDARPLDLFEGSSLLSHLWTGA